MTHDPDDYYDDQEYIEYIEKMEEYSQEQELPEDFTY